MGCVSPFAHRRVSQRTISKESPWTVFCKFCFQVQRTRLVAALAHKSYALLVRQLPMEAYVKYIQPEKIAQCHAKPDILNVLQQTDVLLLDEVSMISATKWSVLHYRLCLARHNYLPFGGLQVLGFGDFFQLPPVEKEGTSVKFAFESEFWTAVFPRM